LFDIFELLFGEIAVGKGTLIVLANIDGICLSLGNPTEIVLLTFDVRPYANNTRKKRVFICDQNSRWVVNFAHLEAVHTHTGYIYKQHVLFAFGNLNLVLIG
jgi:hypothetical protein